MEYNQIVELFRNPETVNEGLTELDNYNTAMQARINELETSNARYMETNANLAMKISAPDPVEVEEMSEDEEIEKKFNEMLEDWRK